MKNVFINEEEFNLLFCKKENNKNFTFYYDDNLLDMFDHNFFVVDYMNLELLETLNSIAKNRKYNHLKIVSINQLDILDKGFEKEELLTLFKKDYQCFDIPKKLEVIYKQIKNDDIYDDLLNFEIANYGEKYGIDFTIRKMKRYLDKAKEDNGLNYFGVYLKNELIASCYSFFNNSVVGVDGLFVKEEFRNNFVASNLIKEIAAYYSSPIFLHADNSETPKELYYKLGFKEAKITYSYLKQFKK